MKHNHAAIWLLIFSQLVLTVLWYSPLLFHSVWIEEQGRRGQTAPQHDNLPFVTAVFALIIGTYFISWLVQALERHSFKKGMKTGILLFLGIVAPSIALHYKFLDMSNLVLVIDLGLSFVLVVMSAGLLAGWKKKDQ
jgi:hypothetical protein